MNFLKKLFNTGRKKDETVSKEFTQEQYEQDYELKKKGLENVLGEMADVVGHAIIPFAIGGAVDMYYFPNHLTGTGFATMELLDPDGNGPRPNVIGTYELVAFTKLPFDGNEDKQTSFNLIERRICGIFTSIGNYSFQAVLNPDETCEVPAEGKENMCLIFDHYQPDRKEFRVGVRKHHLLLCLEIFRSELEYARKKGSAALLEKLKQAGYYPYSDLDREAIV
jgi:hypothetical protein